MIHRIKQFIHAMTAKMREEDQLFVKKHLNKKEQELFFQLRVYEQTHSVRVARHMKENECNIEEEQDMIRIGLLHDIGKIKYPLNPIEKSIIVVLDKMTKGNIKKMRRLKMVKCYYEHAQIGYELLCALGGYDAEFLEAIKYHHEPLPKGEKTRLLKQCDDVA